MTEWVWEDTTALNLTQSGVKSSQSEVESQSEEKILEEVAKHFN